MLGYHTATQDKENAIKTIVVDYSMWEILLEKVNKTNHAVIATTTSQWHIMVLCLHILLMFFMKMQMYIITILDMHMTTT